MHLLLAYLLKLSAGIHVATEWDVKFFPPDGLTCSHSHIADARQIKK